MRFTIAAAGAALVASGGFAQAQAKDASFTRELDRTVPELMRDYGVRGVGVALIEKGKVVRTRYYGFADAEKRTRLSANTQFQPASVAKSVTAAGVLRLVQEGRIGLDDPIFNHVTKWQPPQSSYPVEQLTVRRVLSHTSGLSRWTTGLWTVNDQLPSLTAALSGDNPEHEPTRLVFQPGSKYSYSGAGYSLMQLLIEETTGTGFPEYMKSRVFAPLGLNSSRIGWPASGLRKEMKTYDEFGKPLANYRTVELGAGGWVTTLPDLAKYASSFARVNRDKGPLTRATKTLMMTPAPNAKVTDNISMGLGLFVESTPDGRTLVGHTGGNPGVGALFSIDPDTGEGIAVVLNRSWANQIYEPIACEWRNAIRPPNASAETCKRDPTGLVLTAAAEGGLAAGKKRFDILYAAAPDTLSESKVSWLAERFYGAGRVADSIAVLHWHPKFEQSAELHEILGEILNASGDLPGARAAWTETLRLQPGREGIEEKIKAISQPN